jgi:Tfp pilus assembly protein PilO
MRASSKRTLSILVALLLLIGAVLIYSSLIKPAYADIKDLRSEAASRINIIEENQAYIVKVQNLLNEYQNAAQIQNAISVLLPDGQNISQALNQISGLALISGLSVQKVSVSQLAIRPSLGSSIVKNIGTLRFEAGVSGTYQSFKSFLQKLETNMGIFDVNGIKVDLPSRSSSNNFSYTVVIDSYYQTQ